MERTDANENAIVKGEKYRFTVLTDRLIRLEYSEDGIFEDRPTQCVVNRNFPVPKYTVKRENGDVIIETDCIKLTYHGGAFTKNSLNISFNGEMAKYIWNVYYFGQKNTTHFPGTVRTLDLVDGEVELPPGIVCDYGMTTIDDSESLVQTSDFVEVRKKGIVDTYVFAYADAIKENLDAYYKLTGNVPLLPRFALGNWWSKYHKYTEKEYIDLMKRFESEEIPISVAVIDMDWHKVDIEPKYGSGWTGYSWNTDFFPNPERFLDALHKMHIKTSLNLHPAEGISAHENCYKKAAEDMGVDSSSGKNIPFDIADKKFIDVYFNDVLKPLEDMGVDFWWMDWQQGNTSKMEGLDPLWMLNHFHYEHARKGGRRGIMFSRFSGYGSQRYPIGFSGDSVVSWKTLDFQPYFTICAANVGYTWWSHDIGGHLWGVRDDELMNRWTQFGVFSPIMRLHSSNNEFNDREPWNFNYETHQSMRKFMRLRCEMMPYLYTMNYLTYKTGRPIVEPMYYEHTEKEAETVRNQYYFGTELIVSPITHKKDAVTNMGNAMVYLPKGEWFDFFNKYRYSGNRFIKAYRKDDEMPVFAKAGAIIPMSDTKVLPDENPDTVVINLFPGDNNSFTLYEDDNLTEQYLNGKYAETKFVFDWVNRTFSINITKDDADIIPKDRKYKIILNCVDDCSVTANVKNDKLYEGGAVIVETGARDNIKIEYGKDLKITENDYRDRIYKILYNAQTEYETKSSIMNLIRTKSKAEVLSDLSVTDMDADLKSAILEIIL